MTEIMTMENVYITKLKSRNNFIYALILSERQFYSLKRRGLPVKQLANSENEKRTYFIEVRPQFTTMEGYLYNIMPKNIENKFFQKDNLKIDFDIARVTIGNHKHSTLYFNPLEIKGS